MLASVLKQNAEVCIPFQHSLDRQNPRLYLTYILGQLPFKELSFNIQMPYEWAVIARIIRTDLSIATGDPISLQSTIELSQKTFCDKSSLFNGWIRPRLSILQIHLRLIGFMPSGGLPSSKLDFRTWTLSRILWRLAI